MDTFFSYLICFVSGWLVRGAIQQFHDETDEMT